MVEIMKRWKERGQQILTAYSQPGNRLYRALGMWKTFWETSRMCVHTFRLHSEFSLESLQEGPSKSFQKLFTTSLSYDRYTSSPGRLLCSTPIRRLSLLSFSTSLQDRPPSCHLPHRRDKQYGRQSCTLNP